MLQALKVIPITPFIKTEQEFILNSTTISPKVIGYLCALCATIIWSGNFVVARGLMDSIPPVALAYWRWLVAILVFIPFAIKPTLKDWQVIRSHLPYLAICALLGVTAFNTLIYIASHSTTAINLSLIAITFPIFVIILARLFLSEALSLRKTLGIVLVILGVVLLVSKGHIANLMQLTLVKGDGWMLLASICFAGYSILVKHKPQTLSGWSFQFITFVLGLIFLLPFYLWETQHSTFSITEISLSGLGAILYIGILASLIAFIVWGKAIELIGPTQSSVTYYTLPVFSGLAAYLFLDEQITAMHFISMSLIITGVLVAALNSKRSTKVKSL